MAQGATGEGTGGVGLPLGDAGVCEAAVLAELLDQLGIAFCLYDAADRVVAWNEAFLGFFPEQAETIRIGVPYAETLVRFFQSNLPDTEQGRIDRHVAAAVVRHRTQRVPFIFQRKTGRWLKVASLPLAGGGRVRIWRDVTGEQSAEAGAGQPTAARALAALDVGYAVFDAAGGFLTANKCYHELFPQIGDLFTPGSAYSEHLRRIAEAALAEPARATLERLGARPDPAGEPLSLAVLLRRREGGWLQYEERYGEDGTIVVLWADATRQAEAEERIVKLEGYLREAVEAIPHGLLLFDTEGALILANRRLARIAPELAPLKDEAAPLARLAAWWAAAPGVADPAAALARLNGPAGAEEIALAESRWLRLEWLRTTPGDLLVLLTDVSRERLAEAELRRQREAAHQAEKLTALGSLLAGVAHELNNPLSIVLGRAALLEDEVTEAPLRDQVHAISLAAGRCAKVVRSFLELARQRPPSRRAVGLNDVVRDAVELLDYGLRSAGIAAGLELDDRVPPIEADPDQLSQVMINLLVNAQQALTERPEPRRLVVRTSLDEAVPEIRLTVADNGSGIPVELRERVFEPFFTTKKPGLGTGLGLSMSLGHVRAHGGDIEIGQSPEGGAGFTVRLPVMAPAAAPPEVLSAPPEHGPRRRILIAEDEPTIGELIARILDRHETVFERNGNAALARLRSEPFDLVVCDLVMPGLDGPGLWRAAAELERPRPPFVFVTGDVLRAERSEVLAEAGCPVLDKPFAPGELRAVVARLLADPGTPART